MSDEQESDRSQSEAPIPMPMPLRRAQQTGDESDMTGRETYNVVTDTIAGPNIRLRDNLFQAVVVSICAVIGTAIGAVTLFPGERLLGAMLGAIAGLIGGVLLSGFALMIYRGVRHMRGKHD